MLCPSCNNALIVLELEEVEIDFCPSCEGIWLDSGELELLIQDESERKKIFETFFHEPDHPEKHYKCPICSKRMNKVFVGDNKEVLIDRCVKGHGLWSDKGELYNIMKMTREGKVINLLREIFNNKLSSK